MFVVASHPPLLSFNQRSRCAHVVIDSYSGPLAHPG
jgi:hypothetical protein